MCVAAVRVRRVEIRLDLFGEVELRFVSAAAAVSWKLRFLFAVARRTQGAASARRTRPGAKYLLVKSILTGVTFERKHTYLARGNR